MMLCHKYRFSFDHGICGQCCATNPAFSTAGFADNVVTQIPCFSLQPRDLQMLLCHESRFFICDRWIWIATSGFVDILVPQIPLFFRPRDSRTMLCYKLRLDRCAASWNHDSWHTTSIHFFSAPTNCWSFCCYGSSCLFFVDETWCIFVSFRILHLSLNPSVCRLNL